MRRREFIVGSSATVLARPAVGATAKILVYVPPANLPSLDPVWTTAAITADAAGLVFETLYGRDSTLTPRPQMLAGHVVEDDGKRWTMTLRDGLTFHDGTRVLARDCVASLHRWIKRDPVGDTIEKRLDALEAPDDRTIVFRLRQRFPALPSALAKTQPTPAIMPERLALTDPYKQVREIVGSGPFRFVADEQIVGARAVFARFEGYVPRSEPVDFAAGGRRVLVDRVEWRIIPDSATAANALAVGEVDWLLEPLPDLLPMLRKQKEVIVGPIDTFGWVGGMRLNHVTGPTANPGVRRAMLAAIDQTEVMTAVMGDDRSLWRAPIGFFMPGSPSETDAGMERVREHPGDSDIRGMLKAAGYDGERIVVMHPTDQSFYAAMTDVCVAAFRRVGITVDDQASDWGTVVQRRDSREPLDHGGWSAFASGYPAADYRDPIFAKNMREDGPAAFAGWPNDPVIEADRDAWMNSDDPIERKSLDAKIQARAFETVPFIPLGLYLPPSAWRANVKGLLKGPTPVFWNVEKA